MPVYNRTPYRNLILTGTMGVGKTGIGQRISSQLEEAGFIDFEVEIQEREGMDSERIRETFGLSRLRSLEAKLVEEMTLRRSTVIAVSGLTFSDPVNIDRLRETGPILCVKAAWGEILRRLHVAQGGRFHSSDARTSIVGRLKRESEVLNLDLPTLNTTSLTLEEATQKAIDFWMEESDL